MRGSKLRSRKHPGNRTKPETLFGIDRGRFEIVGDIGDPIDVEWEAETGGNWDEPL